MDEMVDTNILLRWAQPTHPQHQDAVDAIKRIRAQGDKPVLAPQNIVEFWNAATRPRSANGFELTPTQADVLVQQIERLFHLLPESADIYPEWRRIVVSVGVSGRQVHDARIAATMLAHGITHILTFNVKDFQRFPGIIAVHP